MKTKRFGLVVKARFLVPLAAVLLTACSTPGPTPEQIAAREKRAEEARQAEARKRELATQRQQCLEEAFDKQRSVLEAAGYNVRYRKADVESTWSSGAAPKMPGRAMHFLRKLERGEPPYWFNAQLYINPRGMLLIDPKTGKQSETSSEGRVAFQVYALVPGGYPGGLGTDTRFARKPFAVSFRDVFHQPGDGDYLVAVMPRLDRLPGRIQQLHEKCAVPGRRLKN